MITLDEVAAFALSLAEVEERDRRGTRVWDVAGKTFAWERPFSRADVQRFGDEPVPDGDIVAIRTADLHDKEAVLAQDRPGVFTIPHFDGYSAVLVHLRVVHKRTARELLTDGWLAVAPPRLVAGR